MTVLGDKDAVSISPLIVLDINGLRTMTVTLTCMLIDLAWPGGTEWDAIMGATPAGVSASTLTICVEAPELIANGVFIASKWSKVHVTHRL